MLERRGVEFNDIIAVAEKYSKPIETITADCTGVHEYDDAIAVDQLPTGMAEAYRVTVCSVDTSKSFNMHQIRNIALEKTESMYHNPNSPDDEYYDPMLPPDITQKLHFASGRKRSAMMVSFVVGPNQPITDVDIDFNKIEIVKNMRYDHFGRRARYSENAAKFARAAASILHQLRDNGDMSFDDVLHELIHVPKLQKYKRGSNINQTFMIAANHVIGPILRKDSYPVIQRAHTPSNPLYPEILDRRIAVFTLDELPHEALGLSQYCRGTSPLRRLEDFVTVAVAKARHDRRQLDASELRFVNASVQRLNQRIIAESLRNGPLKPAKDDRWSVSEANSTVSDQKRLQGVA